MDADILTPELTTTAHCWSSHCLVQVGNTLSCKVILGPIFKLLGQSIKEWRLFSKLHYTPLF